LLKGKPKPVERKQNVRLAGRIYLVNKAAGYVLIRRYGPWRVGDDELVESRGDGRTANLLPTGERLGEHVAADIRSGDVEVGDGVYVCKILTSQDAKPSGNPEKPTPPDNQPTEAQTP